MADAAEVDTHSQTKPAEVDATVLRAIATELRNLPRPCIQDRQELVHWLARRAAVLDSIAERVEHPAEAATP